MEQKGDTLLFYHERKTLILTSSREKGPWTEAKREEGRDDPAALEEKEEAGSSKRGSPFRVGHKKMFLFTWGKERSCPSAEEQEPQPHGLFLGGEKRGY